MNILRIIYKIICKFTRQR